MGKRIFSTVALWTIVGGSCFYFGANAAVWLVVVLALASQWEFYGLIEKMGRRPFKKFGVFLGGVMILGTYYANRFLAGQVEGIKLGLIAVSVVACCLRIIPERRSDERIEALSSTLFGLIYVPFMLNFMVRIIELPNNYRQGVMLLIWMIVCAKFCDVGALLAGKAFGKHPMSPNTSPKKTWEGAIGGCVIATGLGFLLTWLASDAFPPFFTPFWGAVFALPVAALSIVSDLVESMIKRQAEQKDSGSSIPGIGGAFDLTDSLILPAPTAFLLMGLIS